MSGPSEIPITAAEEVPPEQLEAIRVVVSEHRGLKAVLDWCLGQEPPILDTDVVTQDEFTHDLIVPLPSELYVVYDST